MSNYTDKDQKNLIGLLEETWEEHGVIEEGLWDRLKARGSQAVGAVRGAGQQLKGATQQVAGGMANKAGQLGAKGVQALGGTIDPSQNKLTQMGQNMQQRGAQNIQDGSVQANDSLIDSYKQSVQKNIQNLVAEIQNDLTKLGLQLDTKKFSSFSKSMTTSLVKSLDLLKSGQTGGSQPPPLPQQTPTSQKGRVNPNSLQNRMAMPESEEDVY
jgi:hypothetical protein